MLQRLDRHTPLPVWYYYYMRWMKICQVSAKNFMIAEQAACEYIDAKVSCDAVGKDRPRRPVRPAARRSEEESSTLAGGSAEPLSSV